MDYNQYDEDRLKDELYYRDQEIKQLKEDLDRAERKHRRLQKSVDSISSAGALTLPERQAPVETVKPFTYNELQRARIELSEYTGERIIDILERPEDHILYCITKAFIMLFEDED